MILFCDQLYREFYKKEKENYPDLTKEEILNIIRETWSCTRELISGNHLYGIRIKHFGLFVAKPRRVNYLNNRLEKSLKKGYIEKKSYLKNKRTIRNYMIRNKELLKEHYSYMERMNYIK